MDDKELKKLVDELRKANEALEAGAKNTGELKEKIAKIEVKLADAEKANQELVLKMQEEKKCNEERAESYKALERQLKRMPNGGVSDETKAHTEQHIKIFEKWMRFGSEELSADERKFLSASNDPNGGYLAPLENLLEINKKITLKSPLRQISKVRTITRPGANSYRRDTLVGAYWADEAEDFTESASKYGKDEIPLHKLTGLARVSIEDLTGSAFDMEKEVNSDLVESFEAKESESFITGNGKKRPQGFLNCSGISVVKTGVANGITFDIFADLYGAIKTGYKPVFLLSRKTIASVMKLKDTTGRYLWQAGNIAAGVPNQIEGLSYLEAPHMPDIGTGTTPIACGDFSKGYLIVDGLSMQVLRNPFKDEGFVRFTAYRLVGGQVIMPEAIAVAQCAV